MSLRKKKNDSNLQLILLACFVCVVHEPNLILTNRNFFVLSSLQLNLKKNSSLNSNQ
jgi:hypothetical protein